MTRKCRIGRIAAAVLFSVGMICAATTAMAGKDGTPNGKPFNTIQGQLSAIESSIAGLQLQINDLVSDTTSLEERIVINEQFITTLQADNVEIKSQLLDLANNAESQGIAIDTNAEQIQALIISSLANAGKIQYLEAQVAQLEQEMQGKQEQLTSQCPEGMALTAVYPDGSIECETFLTPADSNTFSQRVVKKTALNLPPSETKYWCPSTLTHHTIEEIKGMDAVNFLICWGSAGLSTSLYVFNPYSGLTFGQIDKTTPESQKDLMCSSGEVAVWGGGSVPDARYASIKGIEPLFDENTGESGFRVYAQRNAPSYPTFCGPWLSQETAYIAMPNLLVDPKYCENTSIDFSVICFQ